MNDNNNVVHHGSGEAKARSDETNDRLNRARNIITELMNSSDDQVTRTTCANALAQLNEVFPKLATAHNTESQLRRAANKVSKQRDDALTCMRVAMDVLVHLGLARAVVKELMHEHCRLTIMSGVPLRASDRARCRKIFGNINQSPTGFEWLEARFSLRCPAFADHPPANPPASQAPINPADLALDLTRAAARPQPLILSQNLQQDVAPLMANMQAQMTVQAHAAGGQPITGADVRLHLMGMSLQNGVNPNGVFNP